MESETKKESLNSPGGHRTPGMAALHFFEEPKDTQFQQTRPTEEGYRYPKDSNANKVKPKVTRIQLPVPNPVDERNWILLMWVGTACDKKEMGEIAHRQAAVDVITQRYPNCAIKVTQGTGEGWDILRQFSMEPPPHDRLVFLRGILIFVTENTPHTSLGYRQYTPAREDYLYFVSRLRHGTLGGSEVIRSIFRDLPILECWVRPNSDVDSGSLISSHKRIQALTIGFTGSAALPSLTSPDFCSEFLGFIDGAFVQKPVKGITYYVEGEPRRLEEENI